MAIQVFVRSALTNVNRVIALSILLILIGSLVVGLMPISVRAEEPAVNPVLGSSDTDANETDPLMDEGSGGSLVNFDDIPLPPDTHQQILIYAGITWDSGLPDYWGEYDGGWGVYNSLSYATPFSPPNYAYNAYGAINPGFNFASQVSFKGAYFMTTTAVSNPSAVRFVGYVSGVPTYYSGWLSLSSTPTYLSADFPRVDRVVVEKQGSGWFAMDDLIYTVPYTLTIHSSPSGVTFTVDGLSRTTPWSENYSEGTSVSLVMPETHDGYGWSRWLEDGDPNRMKTVTMDINIALTGVYVAKPVGGKATPIDKPIIKPELQVPWIWLTTIILSLVSTGVYVKKRKRNTRTLPYVKR